MKRLNKWVGNKIKEARLGAGYRNQIAFAQEIGTRQATVSNWESGQTKPKRENLQAIAKITKKPMSFFEPELGENKDVQLDRAVETLTTALEASRQKSSRWKDVIETLELADQQTIENVRVILGLPISKFQPKAVRRKP